MREAPPIVVGDQVAAAAGSVPTFHGDARGPWRVAAVYRDSCGGWFASLAGTTGAIAITGIACEKLTRREPARVESPPPRTERPAAPTVNQRQKAFF